MENNDEADRLAFEEWLQKDCNHPTPYRNERDGVYWSPAAQFRWQGYQIALVHERSKSAALEAVSPEMMARIRSAVYTACEEARRLGWAKGRNECGLEVPRERMAELENLASDAMQNALAALRSFAPAQLPEVNRILHGQWHHGS